MQIDWKPVLRALGYADEAGMWQDLYVTRALSIMQIATKLDISRNAVRDALAKHGIEIRGRGGPNNQKVVITDEVIEQVRTYGIAAVAQQLGIKYSALYKRLYKIKLTTANRAELEAAEAANAGTLGEGDSGASDENRIPDSSER